MNEINADISMRDWFAGQALSLNAPLGFKASIFGGDREYYKQLENRINEIAKQSYMIADAMLKAREVKI